MSPLKLWQSVFTYPYSIGDLKLHTKTVLFSSIRPEETLGEKINIKNEGKTSATIHLGKVPHYLNVQVNPATLQPDEVGAITILMMPDPRSGKDESLRFCRSWYRAPERRKYPERSRSPPT